MKELTDVRLALDRLASATGADYRTAVADLHVASRALLAAIQAREAWLDRADEWLNDHTTVVDYDRNEDTWLNRLHEYEEMRRVYVASYRAVTAYATVTPIETVAVAEMVVAAQVRMEGV